MTASRLEQLPNEVKDLILDHLFAPTRQDSLEAHKAELRIYTGHVILRRTCPVPPFRFKGCRALMKTCKTLCHLVLRYMYSRLDFNVVIQGNAKDPGQLYCRLTSEYPLGATESSMALRYIKNLRIILTAWSEDDVERLKTRLSEFLQVIRETPDVRIHFISFHTKTSISSSSAGREVAKLLESLRSKIPTQVSNQDGLIPFRSNTYFSHSAWRY